MYLGQLTHLDIAVSGFWGGWFDTLMSDFLDLMPPPTDNPATTTSKSFEEVCI